MCPLDLLGGISWITSAFTQRTCKEAWKQSPARPDWKGAGLREASQVLWRRPPQGLEAWSGSRRAQESRGWIPSGSWKFTHRRERDAFTLGGCSSSPTIQYSISTLIYVCIHDRGTILSNSRKMHFIYSVQRWNIINYPAFLLRDFCGMHGCISPEGGLYFKKRSPQGGL